MFCFLSRLNGFTCINVQQTSRIKSNSFVIAIAIQMFFCRGGGGGGRGGWGGGRGEGLTLPVLPI